MIEIFFAQDGVVIGDRKKKESISMSYKEMFVVMHKFQKTMYKEFIITQAYKNKKNNKKTKLFF